MTNKDTHNWSWASVSSSGANRTVAMKLSAIVKVLLVVVLIAISFGGGYLLGNAGSKNSGLLSVNSTLHHKFALGIVVYISADSITISNENNTNTQAFSITKGTIISVNGHKAGANQLKPGNIVLIRVAKRNPTKASIILANSHFSD